MSRPVSNKPFYLTERKSGPKNNVSETDVCQFISVMLANIRLNEHWKELTNRSWEYSNVPYRGFESIDKELKEGNVDSMLTYIAGYAPPPLLRAITNRTRCLEDVWSLIRKWAGIQVSGLKLLGYARLQNSWDPTGDMSATEFYYVLRDSMEDTLLIKDGKVKHENLPNTMNETMTPALESVVVKDWLVAIGGNGLFEHVCRVYSKDLETETLATIQDRISQNIDCLTTEVETVANYVQISKTFSMMGRPFRRGAARNRGERRTPANIGNKLTSTSIKDQDKQEKQCTYCKKIGRTRFMNTHTVGDCWELSKKDRVDIARVETFRHNEDTENETDDSSDEEDEKDQPQD